MDSDSGLHAADSSERAFGPSIDWYPGSRSPEQKRYFGDDQGFGDLKFEFPAMSNPWMGSNERRQNDPVSRLLGTETGLPSGTAK